ncbi:cyclohexanecarboxylate-CoA ligase [Rhizorhabdus wittichii DC-6]|nr:cyclohexanecarboxylate-CoA ligase [Rhizorhabdus wittichii DC-6]
MDAMTAIKARSYPVREGRASTTLDDFLALASNRPDEIGLVSYLTGRPEPVRLSYARMAELVDKLALRLLDLGVRPRSFVAFQLPNRWEFAIAHLATIRIGAISNAIMPIYGKREMRFMLERTKSRVCIALARTPKSEPGKMLAELCRELDTLEHLVLIDDGDPVRSLEGQLADVIVDEAARARLDRLRPRPDDIEAILFSSGTTGEPKAILHSFNSIYRATSNSFDAMEMSGEDVVLMFSPLGHATGFYFGLEMPLICGCRMVFQDMWNPEAMLRIIERERVTWTMGSASFAEDACDAAERVSHDTSSFRCFVSGGAPIPPKLVGRTSRLLGAQLIPSWGMTEAGITTIGRLTDGPEKRASSAGRAVDGVEVRVVDDAGEPLPPDTPGHLQLRASGQHVGLFMNDELYAASFQEGWFRTGDLGQIGEDGYVRIIGRSKDIVIRGGENVPIIEIENLIRDLPMVKEVVIVGVPDARLGERCHAVIVPRAPGQVIGLGDVTRHLEALGVTKQYWPEYLTMAEELPRTSSGKIQRFVIRDQLIAKG